MNIESSPHPVDLTSVAFTPPPQFADQAVPGIRLLAAAAAEVAQEDPFPPELLSIPPPLFSRNAAQPTLTGDEVSIPFTLPPAGVDLIGRAFATIPGQVGLENLQPAHNLYVSGAIPGIHLFRPFKSLKYLLNLIQFNSKLVHLLTGLNRNCFDHLNILR